jgi:hypothetical protein
MSTVFLRKKQWLYIALSQILAGFMLICMSYAVLITNAQRLWIGKSFYFLVSKDSNIEAGSYEARLDGGAGYLFDYAGNSYIVWSLYLNEKDGMTVQAGLVDSTQLLKVNISYLYFKTRTDKKRSALIQGALNTFYSCIEVLSQGLTRLDQGMTQQACKRILTQLNKEYSYMSKIYRDTYPQFSEACQKIQTGLKEILSKTILGKDIRYLLCSACDAYIRLASVFCL